MKTVGIKVLKNNLSRYLHEVRAGETVWVTDRDEVIAEIHSPAKDAAGLWEAWLCAQERSGTLRRAHPGGPSLGDAWELPAPVQPMDLNELLDVAREDRF